MAAGRKELKLGSRTGNKRRRTRASFSEALKVADARARARATRNRPAGRRRFKHIQAAIAVPYEDSSASPDFLLRAFRWGLALTLLPLCGVTSWTYFDQLSGVALDRAFWITSEFWYFATGALLMTGWFVSGLFWNAFLYLYVLGHELTHILAIWLFRGKISDWGVSVDGGYVTTDKSNIFISLAPYFVPLWATLLMGTYAAFARFLEPTPTVEKTIDALLGFFWAFHLLWTLWMIPRDQPDLKENGTFLSLAIIYLANLLLVIFLTSLASDDFSLREFAREWLIRAEDLARTAWVITQAIRAAL
ncbi:hypothetical protein HNR46_003908 [Haloferula luteola]|uniref:Uncharacterized protein n=1 Tax=Haloferula luteola TaxID=595692 RepID=A0A840V5W9_9BACT|nr:hypothetical protein [Haloferula luteola]MBB5353647.1 hypothetical protein [Haloferula luteola]